jgi:hypothetical protein
MGATDLRHSEMSDHYDALKDGDRNCNDLQQSCYMVHSTDVGTHVCPSKSVLFLTKIKVGKVYEVTILFLCSDCTEGPWGGGGFVVWHAGEQVV